MISLLQKYWAWLLVVLGVIYGVVGAAQLFKIPDASFWTAYDKQASVLLFALSGVLIIWSAIQVFRQEGAIRSFGSAIDAANQTALRETRLRQLESACKPLLVIIAEDFGIPILNVAVHAWRVDDAADRLQRVTSYSVHSRVGSGVIWTPGKGVVGRCWRDQQELVIDLSPLRTLTRVAFEAMSNEDRYHMTWQELQRSKEYEAVWAIPVKSTSEGVIGCVSIDTYGPGTAPALKRASESAIAQGVVGTVRSLLAELA